MIPHLDPYDVDIYPELLQLNQERARLHLEHGTVMKPFDGELPTLLKEGYFIQVSPMTDKNKNTHFETHIVYGCTVGCCFFIEADSLDMRESLKYYNYDMFKAHMPKTIRNWKWYNMTEIKMIGDKLDALQRTFRRNLAKRILGIESDEVIDILVEQVNMPSSFNFQDFMNQN
jgi:hypothetical protein